jgi:hypothetical protein
MDAAPSAAADAGAGGDGNGAELGMKENLEVLRLEK